MVYHKLYYVANKLLRSRIRSRKYRRWQVLQDKPGKLDRRWALQKEHQLLILEYVQTIYNELVNIQEKNLFDRIYLCQVDPTDGIKTTATVNTAHTPRMYRG